jgi:hypothetical protein
LCAEGRGGEACELEEVDDVEGGERVGSAYGDHHY